MVPEMLAALTEPICVEEIVPMMAAALTLSICVEVMSPVMLEAFTEPMEVADRPPGSD
jgi:hypothetical protein